MVARAARAGERPSLFQVSYGESLAEVTLVGNPQTPNTPRRKTHARKVREMMAHVAVQLDVRSDHGVFRRHIMADTFFGVLLGTGAILIPQSLSGGVDKTDLAAALLVALLTTSIRASPNLWWWWQSGRVRYLVADGRLLAESRGRIVLDIRCDDIHQVQVNGYISWRDLGLVPLSLNEFPRATVTTSAGRSVGPPIALWADASTALEVDLRNAIPPWTSHCAQRGE